MLSNCTVRSPPATLSAAAAATTSGLVMDRATRMAARVIGIVKIASSRIVIMR